MKEETLDSSDMVGELSLVELSDDVDLVDLFRDKEVDFGVGIGNKLTRLLLY